MSNRRAKTECTARVHDLKFQIRMFAGRKSLSRKTDHFRRSVNSGDRTLRHGTGQLGGHLAIAAADIEDVFVAAQMELRDEFARPDLLRGGIRGVIRRIPPHVFFCPGSSRGNEAHFKCKFEPPYVGSYG